MAFQLWIDEGKKVVSSMCSMKWSLVGAAQTHFSKPPCSPCGRHLIHQGTEIIQVIIINLSPKLFSQHLIILRLRKIKKRIGLIYFDISSQF